MSEQATNRPLRILEVGGYSFFKEAAPQQTELVWAAMKPPREGISAPALGPLMLLRLLGRLRRGEFDLVAMHVPQYAPWHPRSFLTALRDWNWRGPLGVFSTFAFRLITKFHDVPVAAVDLADSCLIGRHNFALLGRCRAFFKRELPSDHWLAFCGAGYQIFPGRRWRLRSSRIALVEKLRPISLGAYLLDDPALVPSNTEKTADVFFIGAVAGNSTVRSAGLAELQALAGEGYVIDIPAEPMPIREFWARMAKSWLAWSPSGLGWDCLRHYEAPAVGCVPVMNHPTILRDMPLQDGEHCFLYAMEPGGLARTVRAALADKERLRTMARAGSEHVFRHHTMRARAERIAMAVLNRRLDGTPA